MKKIFNWTFGSVFRTIGRIIAYLIIAGIFGYFLSRSNIDLSSFLYKILGLDVISATTITPHAVLYDETTSDITNFDGFYSSSGFNYSTMPSNVQGQYYWEVGSLSTAISGKAYAFKMGFYDDLTANKYYDITLNFNSRDLRYVVNSSNISLYTGYSLDGRALSLVDVTNEATTSHNSYTLVIRVFASTNITTWGLGISGGDVNLTSVNNFGISSVDIVEVTSSDTNIIIDNASANTQNIINSNTENTQNIINNQNELLGSKCENLFDTTLQDGPFGFADGLKYDNSDYSSTLNKISVIPGETYYYSFSGGNNSTENGILFYNNNSFISVQRGVGSFTVPNNANYININFNTPGGVKNITNIMLVKGSSSKPYCDYGSYNSKLDDTNSALNGLNDTINDDDSSSATSEANSFFSNFTTNTHGLTGIITAPLNAINSLTSATCSPLVLPLPFVNQNLTLPCMRSIYVENFGGFMNIYDVIVMGIVSYWVMVRIFALVKDFKNPDHDEIEVLDL